MALSTKPKRILLTGGGSGGHIYPLIAVAEALTDISKDRGVILDMRYFGPVGAYAEALSGKGVKPSSIVSAKFRRYFSLLNLIDVPKFFIGLIQSLFKVLIFFPDVIFSKGGTGALPVVLAGWFYRIPIVIHESDVFPGLTNAISSRFATKITVSFDYTLKYFSTKKAVSLGNPLRKKFLGFKISAEDAKKNLGFNPGEPLILVMGGSQGSERLNNFILSNLRELLQISQILHQTGQVNYDEVRRLSKIILPPESSSSSEDKKLISRYQAIPFLESNLEAAFSAADLIVGRSGSGTIFETAAFGKPSILIPLKESANDHQRGNAYEFAKTGAAIVIDEENLMPGIFINQAKEILINRVLSEKMKTAAGNFFKPEASKLIAGEVLKLALKGDKI